MPHEGNERGGRTLLGSAATDFFMVEGDPLPIRTHERRDEGKGAHFDILLVMDNPFSFGNYPVPGGCGRTYGGQGVSERIGTRTYRGQYQPQFSDPPPAS